MHSHVKDQQEKNKPGAFYQNANALKVCNAAK
jgi:hypothetical protein